MQLAESIAAHQRSPRWSPDGADVVFHTGAHELEWRTTSSIWVVKAANGRAHRITPGEGIEVSPAWLPDSRSLLFISDRDGVSAPKHR